MNSEEIAKKHTEAASTVNKLTRGNNRFVQDPQYVKERELTENSQSPCLIIVSCSDSRVSVPLIFDIPHIGRIFEIRTAGQALASSDLETIKYAIETLESSVKIVIVLGHTHCGAVKAAVHSLEDSKEAQRIRLEYPTIVRNIIPAIGKVIRASGDKISVKKLIQKTEVQNAIDKAHEVEFLLGGKAPVIPAIYNIDSGKVTWL